MAEPSRKTAPDWRIKWSIGIYNGATPLKLSPAEGVRQPAIPPEFVTDIPCSSVADPFLFRHDNLYYLFFEALNKDTDRGEIAYATSRDGNTWTYGAAVLREPFHLSYPQVFSFNDEILMIPETRQANAVRLYRAKRFPDTWQFAETLLEGFFADATVVQFQNRWWLFVQRGLDELCLFSNTGLSGQWTQHPSSPLWPGNRRKTRPGGRILNIDGRLLRFAQDGLPSYGNCLRVFEIDRLTPSEYKEHELTESPVLKATGNGWNAVGMHHMDALQTGNGHWIAAVDGACIGLF